MVVPGLLVLVELLDRDSGDLFVGLFRVVLPDGPERDRAEVPLVLGLLQGVVVDDSAPDVLPVAAVGGGRELEDRFSLREEMGPEPAPRPGRRVVGLVNEQVAELARERLLDLGRALRDRLDRGHDDVAAPRERRRLGGRVEPPLQPTDDGVESTWTGDGGGGPTVVLADLLEEPERRELPGDLSTERAGRRDHEEAIEPLRDQERDHRLRLPRPRRHDDGPEVVRDRPVCEGRVDRPDLGRAEA